MVGGISQSGGTPYNEPPSTSRERWVISQMQQFEQELRADMGPPVAEEKLEELLPKMEQFLTENKQTIYNIMKFHNYRTTGPFNIDAEFNSAISSLKTYLSHPNQGSLDLLNESVTQINFYLTHFNI